MDSSKVIRIDMSTGQKGLITGAPVKHRRIVYKYNFELGANTMSPG